jgi:hypothetical protein
MDNSIHYLILSSYYVFLQYHFYMILFCSSYHYVILKTYFYLILQYHFKYYSYMLLDLFIYLCLSEVLLILIHAFLLISFLEINLLIANNIWVIKQSVNFHNAHMRLLIVSFHLLFLSKDLGRIYRNFHHKIIKP